MELQNFTLGDLQTNCYLLSHQSQAVIIDPADAGDFLNEELSRQNLQLQAVILTHGHFDHCLGLLSLATAWPGLKIYLHPADNFLLKKAPDNAQFWLGRSVDPVPPATHPLTDQQQFKLLNATWQVIHTPGHTPGSVSLLVNGPEQSWLFCGDTLFAQGVGRSDFSYSDPQALQTSLQKLHQLKNNGRYDQAYPGHGPSF